MAVDTSKAVTGFPLAIPMQYDMASSFSDGLALVGTNVGKNLGTAESPYYDQKCSYIDASGKVVLEVDPAFSSSGSFRNGKAIVYRTFNEKSERNYIDKTGKLLLERWIDDGRGMGGGYDDGMASRVLYFRAEEPSPPQKYWTAFIYGSDFTKNEVALFDNNLKEVIPFGTYNWIEWIPDTEYVNVSISVPATDPDSYSKNLYGIIKLDGSVVLEPKYSSASYLENYGFAVQDTSDAPCRLLFHDGTSVAPQGYTASNISVKDDKTFLFEVREPNGDRKYGIMDKTGKVLSKPVPYDDTDLFNISMSGLFDDMPQLPTPTVPSGMEMLNQNDKMQIVATGKPYTEDNKLVPNVKVGIADLEGNLLIKPTYEAVSLLCNGMFEICNGFTFNADYGFEVSTDFSLVSEDEKIKSEAYKAIGNLSEEMVAVSDGKKWGYLHVNR